MKLPKPFYGLAKISTGGPGAPRQFNFTQEVLVLALDKGQYGSTVALVAPIGENVEGEEYHHGRLFKLDVTCIKFLRFPEGCLVCGEPKAHA